MESRWQSNTDSEPRRSKSTCLQTVVPMRTAHSPGRTLQSFEPEVPGAAGSRVRHRLETGKWVESPYKEQLDSPGPHLILQTRKLPPTWLLKKIQGLISCGSRLGESRQVENRAEQPDWKQEGYRNVCKVTFKNPSPFGTTPRMPSSCILHQWNQIASKWRPDANTQSQSVKTQLIPQSAFSEAQLVSSAHLALVLPF